jgi:hypothetical protein
VLEPFQGTPLASRLDDGRKMDPAEVVGLLRQLASVLDYAHAHGSLHGCLHPSSILLNDRNEIKVLDLGASAAVGRNASPEQLLRAVHFLSPECIRDQAMDGRSDQFSLAALAHAMLTGELPFSGKPLGVMFRIAYQGLERDAIRELPAAAQNVLLRALSKRPAERYPTCAEMVETLANALLRTAPAATRMASAAEFAAVPSAASAPALVSRQRSGVARYFSREGLKYFGVTFVICALALAAIFYFVLPKAIPKAVSITPVSPAPVSGPAMSGPAVSSPKVSNPKAAGAAVAPPEPQAKSRAKKKEAEMEVKPAEPKIIRQ